MAIMSGSFASWYRGDMIADVVAERLVGLSGVDSISRLAVMVDILVDVCTLIVYLLTK